MNVIPNKNLFIVTSALNANVGVVNSLDRFTQTIETLRNLRAKCPDDIVIFVDGSPTKPNVEKFKQIEQYANVIISWTDDEDIRRLASNGMKSAVETAMLFKTIVALKQSPDMLRILHQVKRIYKYSSRSLLDENFDASKYDELFGKYVFKRAMPSWMPEDKKKNITDHLYITRLYSFCPSLIDDYLKTLQKIFENILQHDIDTEHAHYLCVDKRYVVEFEKINCSGIVAGTGNVEHY
jgi:hypothetical protein